jgi:hypothetical protein
LESISHAFSVSTKYSYLAIGANGNIVTSLHSSQLSLQELHIVGNETEKAVRVYDWMKTKRKVIFKK